MSRDVLVLTVFYAVLTLYLAWQIVDPLGSLDFIPTMEQIQTTTHMKAKV